MRTVFLLGLVAWTAARAEAPLRIAVSSLQGVNVPAEAVSFYGEHLAQNLRAPGLTVVTAREISTLLGMERQRQMLGCDASSSCIAELASALGADAVVVGDVARFGETYQINLKVLAAGDAKVLATKSARVDGDVATLDAVARLGKELARALFVQKGRPLPPELAERATTGRTWAFVTLGVGAAAAITGGVLMGLSRADFDALTSKTGVALTEPQAVALRDGGATKQTTGAVLVAAGATALLASGALFLFGTSNETTVSVSLTPSGGFAFVRGRF